MATWHVYLLRCKDDTLYCGITTDLDRRLAAHNAGKASKYTRSRLPAKLVWSVRVRSESTARKREAAIKALSRHEKEPLITIALSRPPR